MRWSDGSTRNAPEPRDSNHAAAAPMAGAGVAGDRLAHHRHPRALGPHRLDQVPGGQDQHALARDEAQRALERGAEQRAAAAASGQQLLRPLRTAPRPEALAPAAGQDENGMGFRGWVNRASGAND